MFVLLHVVLLSRERADVDEAMQMDTSTLRTKNSSERSTVTVASQMFTEEPILSIGEA